jgi:hypothetical protein
MARASGAKSLPSSTTMTAISMMTQTVTERKQRMSRKGRTLLNEFVEYAPHDTDMMPVATPHVKETVPISIATQWQVRALANSYKTMRSQHLHAMTHTGDESPDEHDDVNETDDLSSMLNHRVHHAPPLLRKRTSHQAQHQRDGNHFRQMLPSVQSASTPQVSCAWQLWQLLCRLLRVQVFCQGSPFLGVISLGIGILLFFAATNANIGRRDDLSRTFAEVNILYLTMFVVCVGVRTYIHSGITYGQTYRSESFKGLYHPVIHSIASTVVSVFQWSIISLVSVSITYYILHPSPRSEQLIVSALITCETMVHSTLVETLTTRGYSARTAEVFVGAFGTMCWFSVGYLTPYDDLPAFAQFMYQISPTRFTFNGLLSARFFQDYSWLDLMIRTPHLSAIFYLQRILLISCAIRMVSMMILWYTHANPCTRGVQKPWRLCARTQASTIGTRIRYAPASKHKLWT